MLNRDRQLAASLLIRSARLASRAGQYDEVIRLLTLALHVFPCDSQIYHNRGIAYRHLHRYDEALADFNQAIALGPSVIARSFEQRGIAHFEKGNLSEARKDWEYAASIDPGATIALVKLGCMALEEERYPQAIDYFTQAIAAEPTLAMAFVNRARAYLGISETTEAFADLRKADELAESGRDTSNVDKEEGV